MWLLAHQRPVEFACESHRQARPVRRRPQCMVRPCYADADRAVDAWAHLRVIQGSQDSELSDESREEASRIFTAVCSRRSGQDQIICLCTNCAPLARDAVTGKNVNAAPWVSRATLSRHWDSTKQHIDARVKAEHQARCSVTDRGVGLRSLNCTWFQTLVEAHQHLAANDYQLSSPGTGAHSGMGLDKDELAAGNTAVGPTRTGA